MKSRRPRIIAAGKADSSIRILYIISAALIIGALITGCNIEKVSALTENGEEATLEPTQEISAEPSQTPELTEEPEATPEASGEATPEASEEPTATPNPDEESLIPETIGETTPTPSADETENPEASITPDVSATPDPEATEEESTPSAEEYSAQPSQEVEETPSPEATLMPEETQEPAEGDAYTIVSFVDEQLSFVVERGTAIEDIGFPETLTGINELGETVEVPVAWELVYENCNDAEMKALLFEYESRFGYGPWEFVAVIDTAFNYEGNCVITTLSIVECYTISTICNTENGGLIMRFLINLGEEITMPDNIIATMTDGGYKSVPIIWSGSYDSTHTGTYTLTMNTAGQYSGKYAVAEVVVVPDSDGQ